MAFIRRVRTASGATAVQIAEYVGGRQRIAKHLGSAHTEAELGLLLAQARDLLEDHAQGVLDLGVESAPRVKERPLRSVTIAINGTSQTFARAIPTDQQAILDALDGTKPHALSERANSGRARLHQAGQPLNTLSGGERKRIKLVISMAEGAATYVLDEPTSGLHMADIETLLGMLDGLVSQGNSVIVIEHNLSVMAHADWIIDIGPGAGHDGGQVVFEGTPPDLARADTLTGIHLRDYLAS